ncbi:carbohydrate ABC transporter permease [Bacillus halotolerans]|uniref:carbohydrate ABC transporter permease n=1 Tax=Bacillus halotolerans TaxID=260554 RepID=UPI002DBE79BF|nr:carbohydrate ABC transporter permease [Bacillus halotolerans]MEC3640827.1 carbohydrate ABC transporter permease [Bacillus halotolerans]
MLPQKKTDSFRLEPVPDLHIEVKRKPRRKWYIGETSVWVFLFLYLIAIAYPLLWMVMSAFKSSDDIFENSWSLPSSWHPENFVSAWNQGISSYFMNSVIVTALTCVITVFISAWAAYGLSRFEFKGRGFFLVLCLGGLMLTPQVSLVPLYSIIQSLGLYNTYWALILPYAAYRIPFTIILIRSYFLSISKELEEAAYLDGCTSFGVFFRIFLPMSVPILVTSGILTAYHTWNEFMFAIIFIDDENLRTIPAGLMQFRDALQTDWGVLLAGLTISAAPIIILFLFMQKYFVRGIASGSVKG